MRQVLLLLACTASLICTPVLCGRLTLHGLELFEDSGSSVGSSPHGAAASAAANNSTAASGGSACQHTQGLVLVTMAYASANTSSRVAYLYWLSVMSKRLYAHAQGYPLYVVSAPLDTQRQPAWSKLIALEAVLAHSCAEWVWITDADSWIMSTGFDAAAFAAHHASLHANATGVQPDLLLAHDCYGINTGSMFVRNTPWARQHLADAWFTNSHLVENVYAWWEQAALFYLAQQPGVAAHYGDVPKVLINAYPSDAGCQDSSGTYKPGISHLLHAPGQERDSLTASSEILAPVLEVAHRQGMHHPTVPVYALQPRSAVPLGVSEESSSRAHHIALQRVVFDRSAGAGPSAETVNSVTFEVQVQPRPPHTHNPAWPFSPPRWLRDVVRMWGLFSHAGQ
jgi:galactosyl transferase GMA12/MNN10 family